MRKIIVSIGLITMLGTAIVASTVNIKDNNNPTTVKGYGGNHCDPIEHLMGICRSSQTLLSEN